LSKGEIDTTPKHHTVKAIGIMVVNLLTFLNCALAGVE